MLEGAFPFKSDRACRLPWRMTAHILTRIRRLFPDGASLPENRWRRRHNAILDARSEALAASVRADQSDARFAVAFDNAPIGVALVAPDGRWLDVNQALLQILGYTKEELLATDFQSITHPDSLATDLDFVRRVLSGEIDAFKREKRYFHASGRVIWAELDTSLVRDAAGEPLYFITQIQDVTTGASSRSSSGSRRRWRRSASSPAASRTTSTTS